MKRKVLGITLALVLALVGTAALMAYVEKAKDDAVEDTEQVQVLVVTDTIPVGANLDDIEAATALNDVPARLVVDDALTSLEGLNPALVAGVEMQEGEQLLSSRLLDPSVLSRVDVPEGLQEITLSLAPERAVGGVLRPGEHVGILLSFDPFENGGATDPNVPGDTTPTSIEPRRTPNVTNLTLQQVLVTSVQYSVVDSQRRTDSATEDTVDEPAPVTTVNEAPSQVLLVTLAVTTSQAEQITFAAEFGHIWLTRQNDETDPDGSRIITLDQVYVTVPENE